MGARVGRLPTAAAVAIVTEVVARVIVSVLVVVWVRHILLDTCGPEEFCDDPGLQKLLIAPSIAYLLWNVLAIGVVLSAPGADDPLGRMWGIAILGLVRLFWLPLVVASAGRRSAGAAAAAGIAGMAAFVVLVILLARRRAVDDGSARPAPADRDQGRR